jgi:hypothetical protein
MHSVHLLCSLFVSRLYLSFALGRSLAECFRFRFGLNGGFAVSYRLIAFGFSALVLFIDCLHLSFILALYLPQCLRRFRFGLNRGYGSNYRLDAFGLSALFLVVDCICLMCFPFFLTECAPLPLWNELWLRDKLSTECIRLLCPLSGRRLYLSFVLALCWLTSRRTN